MFPSCPHSTVGTIAIRGFSGEDHHGVSGAASSGQMLSVGLQMILLYPRPCTAAHLIASSALFNPQPCLQGTRWLCVCVYRCADECTVHVQACVHVFCVQKRVQGQASEARLAGCFPASTVCVCSFVCGLDQRDLTCAHRFRWGGGGMYYSYQGWGVMKEGVRGAEQLLLSRTSGFRCGPAGQCRLSFPGRCCFGIAQCELAT